LEQYADIYETGIEIYRKDVAVIEVITFLELKGLHPEYDFCSGCFKSFYFQDH
jgi:hypothetical protein